jgi:hypothetical protein
MSYAFQVRKVNGTLELAPDQHLESIARQIPDGAVYAIAGHTPGPDTSPVGQLQVTLLITSTEAEQQKFVGSASGSYNTEV